MEKSDLRFWENFAHALDILGKDLINGLPRDLPDPADEISEFWNAVRKAEMQCRQALSETIQQILSGESPRPMTETEQLLFRFRLEWAMEFAKDRMRKNLPHPTLREALLFALVGSWEQQGCLEFWRTDGFG